MGVLETFIRIAGIVAYYIYNAIREFLLVGIVFVGNMYVTMTWLIQANGAREVGALDPWLYNVGLIIIWGLWVMFILMLDNVITRLTVSDTADTTTGRIARYVRAVKSDQSEDTNQTQVQEEKKQ